jgi:ATP-dependent DNA helicase RecG
MLVWEKETGKRISFKSTADKTKVVFPLNITTQKTTRKTIPSILKTDEKILGAIKNEPSTTIESLAKTIGLSKDGVKYNLKKLKDSGKIRRIGGDKGGYWEIIK